MSLSWTWLESFYLRWNRSCGDSLLSVPGYSTAVPFTSTPNSLSGRLNSVTPQSKQTRSLGNTQTMGLSRPLSPGKWMATSALSLLWCSERQDLQDITPYLGKTQLHSVRCKAVPIFGREDTGKQ